MPGKKMRLVKFIETKAEKAGRPKWGIVEDDTIKEISTSPFKKWKETKKKHKIYDVRFLAPCKAGKIICAGLNYLEHAKELGISIIEEPVIFLKAATSVLDPGGTIIRPSICHRLDYEAELAVIIGKKIKNCSVKEVDDCILGYTCFNDVTARDIQKIDGQWTRSKSFDTFSPVGPVVATSIDPGRLDVKLYLNGDVMQSSNTSDMVFSAQKIVSYISTIMTLMPGDVIATGTPSGIGEMKPGDVVEVDIEKIGTLKNCVAQEGDLDA